MNQKKSLKRLEFKCWNCQKTFKLTVDVTGNPLFSKECPFCGKRCMVDLNPYRHSEVELLRGNETDLETERLELPNTIPTTRPDDEQAGES